MSNYYHKGSKVLIKGLGVEPQLENFRHMVATKVVSANTTLTGEDSGKVIFCNGGSAIDITLPAPVAGYRFKFIVTDVTADVDIVQDADTSDFVGHLEGLSNISAASSSSTKITFSQSGGAAVGDFCELLCDGTNWYVQGGGAANGGVVFA